MYLPILLIYARKYGMVLRSNRTIENLNPKHYVPTELLYKLHAPLEEATSRP